MFVLKYFNVLGKMETYGSNQIVVLVVILVLAVVVANVTITICSNFADNATLRCNHKAVLICKVQPYSNTMTWEIDNKVVAECAIDVCETYSIANYGFLFDISRGIFNITMDSVTLDDKGKIFKCDDGYTFADITADVTVIPDNRETTISSTKGSSSTEIKVTSGCVYPSTSLQFEWYFFKNGNAPMLYTDSQPLLSTDEYGCTSGPCGGKGVVKVTSTLVIEEDSNGEDFYFQVLIKHPDKTDIIIRAEKLFKLKGTDDTDSSPVTSVAPIRDTNGAGGAKWSLGVTIVCLFCAEVLTCTTVSCKG